MWPSDVRYPMPAFNATPYIAGPDPDYRFPAFAPDSAPDASQHGYFLSSNLAAGPPQFPDSNIRRGSCTSSLAHALQETGLDVDRSVLAYASPDAFHNTPISMGYALPRDFSLYSDASAHKCARPAYAPEKPAQPTWQAAFQDCSFVPPPLPHYPPPKFHETPRQEAWDAAARALHPVFTDTASPNNAVPQLEAYVERFDLAPTVPPTPPTLPKVEEHDEPASPSSLRAEPEPMWLTLQLKRDGLDEIDEPITPEADGEPSDSDSDADSADGDWKDAYEHSWPLSAHASPTPPSASASPEGELTYPADGDSSHDDEPAPPRARPKGAKRQPKMHACSICHKHFPRPSGLATHMNTHSGAKPYKCPVQSCSKSFAVRSNAKRHLRTHGIVPAPGAPFTYADADTPAPAGERKRWVPQSLLRAGHWEGAGAGGEEVSVPLAPVAPGAHDERDSFGRAPLFPYHPCQWRALPGPMAQG